MKTYVGFITTNLTVEPFRLRMRAQTEEAWMSTIKMHLKNAKAKWNTITINSRPQYNSVIWPIFIEGNWIIYTFLAAPDSRTRTLNTHVRIITVNVG
jgi:hypothetical protein